MLNNNYSNYSTNKKESDGMTENWLYLEIVLIPTSEAPSDRSVITIFL